jgi:protein-S-isoprenylcysteine O-methyltransferase Ste14
MRPLLIQTLADIPWVVLVLYRIVTAARANNVKAREASAIRFAVIANQIVAFTLLFSSTVGILPPGRRFVSDHLAVRIAGIIMTWMGIALVLWAQRNLGKFWSARITIRVDHRLIRSGPYARVRHPVYSGLLLAVAGTALNTGEWRGVGSFCLVLIAFAYKIRKEEELLTQEFGEAYQDYRNQSGVLTPRFR